MDSIRVLVLVVCKIKLIVFFFFFSLVQHLDLNVMGGVYNHKGLSIRNDLICKFLY